MQRETERLSALEEIMVEKDEVHDNSIKRSGVLTENDGLDGE